MLPFSLLDDPCKNRVPHYRYVEESIIKLPFQIFPIPTIDSLNDNRSTQIKTRVGNNNKKKLGKTRVNDVKEQLVVEKERVEGAVYFSSAFSILVRLFIAFFFFFLAVIIIIIF